MRFDDQKNKFIVSFNELETNNELMIEKVVKWILNTEFFQNNCVFLCKWQSIKEPTRLQDKRGYLVDNKLKDKIIKKLTIKQADITYYFAIFKIEKDDFNEDFMLEHGFAGQLFSNCESQKYNFILDEIENNMRKENCLTQKLHNREFINCFDLKRCQLISIEYVDNPIMGICDYTYSILHS